MARLDALPSIDIIRGFKGTLDFYLWKGLPCVRSWPRMTKAKQTQATKDAAATFGDILKSWRLTADTVLAFYQEMARGIPRTSRDIYVSGILGHLHASTLPVPPPWEARMYDAYVCLRDKKTVYTAGGTFAANAWRTRVLNEEQADTALICTLAANQFTLPAGSYRCLISAPCSGVFYHQARLYNITDAVVLLLGAQSVLARDVLDEDRAIIAGRFTLADVKTLEVQHFCSQTNATFGFGYASYYTDGIFTIAEFWREA